MATGNSAIVFRVPSADLTRSTYIGLEINIVPENWAAQFQSTGIQKNSFPPRFHD
jgi:hypothetical protein